MSAFKITLLGILCFFSLALGSKCPQDAISKLVVCYYKGEIPLTKFNICNCTHVIFTNAVKRIDNYNISASEDTIKYLETIKEKKENLSTLFTLEAKQDESSKILKSENRSEQLINGIVQLLENSQFDGVELNFKFGSDDGVSKESFSSFVKNLSKILLTGHRRVKRDGYDVFEKVQDDVTTVAYTTQTPKNSTSKTQSIKRKSRKPKENSRKIREKKGDGDESDVDYLTLEEAINAEFSEQNQEKQNTLKDIEEELFVEKKFLVFVRLSIEPEIIAKKYDLKILSRYADILTVPTHHIVNSNEDRLTYHPSRLMGLSDILNTDSMLDFLTGMGAVKSKMVITLPATVLKFQLTDENKNTPRSPSESKPRVIDQSQLCSLFSKSNWTVERDDDLTAPYAFSGKTWLAFEDGISIDIKGKYILLRELAGGAIYPIDSDLNDGLCRNLTGSGGYLTGVLYKNFESLERKPRALLLESLQEEIHDTSLINIEVGVKLSEYRIVRVVDHTGAVHVIRKNTKTQFECSRQGYFSHPLGCNKFYRCVKFDQYSDEFTVFEYDCPAGLAFDERWEVCVWPGSLPHGAPCTGSSEIAPVPRAHYQCPSQEGYYADPENCRWFFACLDHARDGITPLTAYEFRCPFGLVFSEQKLACDWPWLVGSCGNRGAAGYLNIYTAGQSQGVHAATFINGGNLEASFGQYGNTDEENSFAGFGKKFGSILKETNTFNEQGSYQGAQSAGFGYIAGQFDDKSSRGSFAAFPDYEISGGRIFNKGGVVLDQNIAGISDTLVGGIEKGLEGVHFRGGVLGASRSLGKEAGYIHQNIVHSTGHTQDISNKNSQNLGTLKTNILNLSGGQVAVQNSIPTPKTFSVSIPSVQINSEETLKYSEHSTVGSTTPQTLLLKETPLTENVNIQLTNIKLSNENQYSNSQDFTVSQPSVISVVTPKTETHTFGRTVSEGFDSSVLKSGAALSTPSVYFGSTQRTEPHVFNQLNLKQNEFSSKISSNQAAVSVGVPSVTSTHSFEYNAGDFGSKTVHELPPVVTPQPGVHTIEFTASGSGVNQPFISTESPFVSFSQQHQKLTDQSIAGKALQNSAGILTKVPAVKANIFTNVIEQQNFNSDKSVVKPGATYGAPVVTLTPSVTVSGTKTEFKPEPVPVVSSGPILTGVVHSSIDEKISNEIKFNKPQTFAVPTVTPKTEFQYVSKTGSNEYFGQLNGVSKEIPVVTPKPDFQIFSHPEFTLNRINGKSESISLVTPQPDLNSVKYSGGPAIGVGVTPIVPFETPKITATIQSSFGQSYIPVTTPQTNANNYGQNYLLQKKILQEKTSYSVPDISPKLKTNAIVQDGGVSQTHVTPKFDIKFSQAAVPIQPIQPVFGQRYSHSSFKPSEIQLSPIQPFGTVNSTPKPKLEIIEQKVEQPNTLTEVTIEQQPIVSIGTISTTSIDHTLSTPRPLSFSEDKFLQSPPAQNFNIKSKYVQLQPVAVSTPAPIVSTLSTKAFEKVPQPLNVNIISKFPQTYKQEEKRNFESFGPAHQQAVLNIPFNGQKSNFRQEIKSFSPAVPEVHVTTSIPLTYKQEITSGISDSSSFFGKTDTYLPPVTSKPEIFGSVIQQEQPASIVTQQLKFLKTKPLNEQRRTQFIQRLPVQLSTYGPENHNQVKIEQSSGPAVTTSKPFKLREELVGLEISKSIEINPSQFFQLTEDLPRKLPEKTVEIQPQTLHLISQKTFPVKQSEVIQPFYTEEAKEIVHSLNDTPENKFQEPLIFEQGINSKTQKTEILEQKQYLPSAVTVKPQIYSTRYSTTKNINLETFSPDYQQKVVNIPFNSQKSNFGQEIKSFSPAVPEVQVTTSKIEQPVVYSKGSVSVVPALPVFEATRIPLTEQKETTILRTKTNSYQPPGGVVKSSAKSVFIEQFDSRSPQEVISSRVNLLSPISTEAPQLAVTRGDELLLQTHSAFDFKKVNEFGTVPGKTDFINSQVQSTLKPAVSGFETSGYSFQLHKAQNFTSGGSGSGIKYAINPNIEIPEPPREYILAQNGFTTAAPHSATGLIQFTSKSAESGNRFEGLSYIPPKVTSRKKASKVAVTSSGTRNEEELQGDNIQQLFEKYSGRFGQVINSKNAKAVKGNSAGDIAANREASSTIRYEVSSIRPSQNSRRRQYHGGITSGIQATNKYEEYEINGNKNDQKSFEIENEAGKSTLDLKNLKLDNNKKTVIVVSQVSDANPVLIGKLAGQCSCQSNMLEFKSKGKKSKSNSRRKNSQNQYPQATIVNEYLPPFESNQPGGAQEALLQGKAPSVDLEAVVIGGSKPFGQGLSHTTEQNLVTSSTTVHPDLVSSTILSSLGPDGVLSITPKAIFSEERIKTKNKQFRGRTRYIQPSSAPSEDGTSIPLLSPVPASEIASTFDYSVLRGDESRTQNEIDKGKGDGITKVAAGAAYERYGPGGWRSFDETLQGSIDCKRPGLFRHPKYCNKFYACNYDPWKERYTLHVFNCPIHLTYDSSISACNWPVRGPACADDNLLV